MGKGGGRPGVVPVFVGNIGFDISEDQIRDIFQEVGPVVAVRFVVAKDTGKAKGYGFVEFPDLATAESAVRNLNGRDLAGRQLRVDFAEHPDGSRVVVGTRRDGIRTAPPPPTAGPYGSNAVFGMPAAHSAAQAMAATFGGPVMGAPGSSAPGAPPDALTTRLADVSPRQMWEVLAQMKALGASNPAQARALLSSNPQLTRALFQAQLLLGLVKSPAEGLPASVVPGAPLPPGSMPPPLMAPPPLAPPMGYGGGYAAPPPQGQPWMPPGLGGMPHGGYPPDQAPAYGMPPQHYAPPPQPMFPPPAPVWQPAPAPPPAAPAAAPLDVAAQQALLAQVMRLSEAQVAALPEAERQQVRLLQQLARQHQGAGGRF